MPSSSMRFPAAATRRPLPWSCLQCPPWQVFATRPTVWSASCWLLLRVCVLSADATSFSWSHCEPPLSFSCVLEEVNPENKGVCELSWGVWSFKPRHPDCRAETVTLGLASRTQSNRRSTPLSYFVWPGLSLCRTMSNSSIGTRSCS